MPQSEEEKWSILLSENSDGCFKHPHSENGELRSLRFWQVVAYRRPILQVQGFIHGVPHLASTHWVRQKSLPEYEWLTPAPAQLTLRLQH